ncbi:WhiB family transcriptional regulator [Rhodococcus koreensis]
MSQPRFSLDMPAPSTSLWDWQTHAQCRPLDTDLFFPREGEGHGARIRRERTAKEICQSCPVRNQCQNHALSTGEPFGIWGGTTEKDRRHLRQPRITRCGEISRVSSPQTH